MDSMIPKMSMNEKANALKEAEKLIKYRQNTARMQEDGFTEMEGGGFTFPGVDPAAIDAARK